MSNRDPYYEQVAQIALPHLDPEQVAVARKYVREIVDRWLNQLEEGDGYTPEDIIDVERGGFESRLAGTSGKGRLEVLQHMVLTTHVETLSGRALHLAKDVVDEKKPRASVLNEAAALETQIEALVKEVDTIENTSLKKPLLRQLADAGLEMRYIREGGAMSIRLNNYIQQKQA
jgi:hypothetical protein